MIILNEKDYAKRSLEEGILDKNPYQVISILAKYYYHCCNFKKKKIQNLLIDYLRKYYPRYELNEEQWVTTIDKITTNANKRKLYDNNGVKITKQEIEVIKNIKNKTLEKLAFTSLCLAKLYDLRNPNNNGWVNTSTGEIFKMAHVSATEVEQDIKLNKLYILGLVEFPKQIDNLNYRVTFADNNGEEELFVFDFRELGYEYLKYIGEDFIRCAECNILIRQGKTKQKKYCEKHKSSKEAQIKKDIICVDCGKVVEVSAKDNKTSRCPECYDIYRKNRKLETQRMRRKQKTKSEQI